MKIALCTSLLLVSFLPIWGHYSFAERRSFHEREEEKEVEDSFTEKGICKRTTTFKYSAETEITKGNLMTTLSKLGKDYDLSFEVKPTKFLPNQWTSVLHFTIGGKYGKYGDRAPGIWFRKSPQTSTHSLHICSPINGNVNYCRDSEQFPPNQWIKVKISQTMISAGVYEYVIKINDNILHQTTNSKPESFDNVKVYASNPWNIPQPAYIRNWEVTGEGCTKTLFEASAQTEITKNKQLTTLQNFGKVYEVSFEVYPKQSNTEWGNVIHFSAKGDHANYGDLPFGSFQHLRTMQQCVNFIFAVQLILKRTIV